VIYLASPGNQQQAEHAIGMPVLFSFALYDPFLDKYQHTFRRILIDSGAYSAFTTGRPVDLAAYSDWSGRWEGHADAVAGLDDIDGDWRKSLANYEAFPRGFPTMHDTDPPELLPELVAIARERGGWLGIGLKPPRQKKERFVRWVCDNVPEDFHIHGWALRAYSHVRRIDSIDSTNWWRDAMRYRKEFPFLTYGECLEIVVKRYQRESRIFQEDTQATMFPLAEDAATR
jgi:hypothetical protein